MNRAFAVSAGSLAQVSTPDWGLWQPDPPSSLGSSLLLALVALAAGALLGAVLLRTRRRRHPMRTTEPGAWARAELQRLGRHSLVEPVPGSALHELAEVVRAALEARGHAQASKLPLPELAELLPSASRDLLVRLEETRFGRATWPKETWSREVDAVRALLDLPGVERSQG